MAEKMQASCVPSHKACINQRLLNIKCVVLDVDDCFSVGLEADAVSRIGREDNEARGLFSVIDKELDAVPVDDEAQLYLAAAVAYSELALVQHVFRPSAV